MRSLVGLALLAVAGVPVTYGVRPRHGTGVRPQQVRLAAVPGPESRRRVPRARVLRNPGVRRGRASSGRRRSEPDSAARWSPRAASSSSIASAIARWSRRSTPAPGRRSGATSIQRLIETTSGSTKGRARSPWSPMASCTPSAPKDSCTRWISRRGRASGARTRCGATAWPRHSSARGARRSSRTAGSSPTSAGKAPASSRSTRRPARCSGRRPTMRRATRRRWARRLPAGDTRCS